MIWESMRRVACHSSACRKVLPIATVLVLTVVSLVRSRQHTKRFDDAFLPVTEEMSGIDFLNLFRRTETSISPSLDILAVAAFVEASDLVEEPITDIALEAERCDRYHWTFNQNRTTRRRVFWGCNVADDSWHAIFFAALEYHGLLSGVAFVESNTTQTLSERKLRFFPGSDSKRILESRALWGGNALINVDYYFDPPGTTNVPLLARENFQRNALFDVFAKQGMRRDDLAIISDPDETFTRDFLYAIKTCEVPTWVVRPYDCFSQKLLAMSIVMETTPLCVQENYRWHHPDVLPGECVKGIGDEELHPPPARVEDFSAMVRSNDWESQIPEGKLAPLWDASDFRLQSNRGEAAVFGKYPNRTDIRLHTGFHLHNYFESLSILRNKYLTYGHPVPGAKVLPLKNISSDVKYFVNCVLRGNVSDVSNTYHLYMGSPREYTPIALQRHPVYAQLRHYEMLEEYLHDKNETEKVRGQIL